MMYSFGFALSTIKGAFFIPLALVLIFTLGLHAVQVHHEHFGNTNEHSDHDHTVPNDTSGFSILDIAMHLFDKKLLFLLITTTIAFAILQDEKRLVMRLLLTHARKAMRECGRYGNEFRIHNYVALCFRNGTFHSKAY